MSSTPTTIAAAEPSGLSAYIELIKPRMNLLIVGTTFVGFAMTARSWHQWGLLPSTLIGTALCAAAAAVLNQLIERHHDALMPRTAQRPLPSGRVRPSHALVIGLSTALAGSLYLLLMVNALTALLAGITLASYVLIYTPLKRITTLNTLVGAIPGAIPPVMGCAAAGGTLGPSAAVLFAILFLWQIPHFMAIAILYREDYRLGGFRMMPVSDPQLRVTRWWILAFTLALIPASLAPSALHITGWIFTVSAALAGAIFLWYALRCAALRTRLEARKLFFVSIIYLPALLTVLMLDRI